MTHPIFNELHVPFLNAEDKSFTTKSTLKESYIYQFDQPMSETGLLELTSNKIMLKFPEKNTHSECDTVTSNYHVVFFCNNILLFSYQWLPIVSLNDFYKIKDMLKTCMNEYYRLCDLSLPNFYEFSPIYYSENIVQLDQPQFSLKLFENEYYSCVELFFNEKNTEKLVPNKFVEIYIGKNLVFSENLFLNMNISLKMMHTLVFFILQKLAKC